MGTAILVCVTVLLVTAVVCLAWVVKSVADNDHEEGMRKMSLSGESCDVAKRVIDRLMKENKELKKELSESKSSTNKVGNGRV